MDSQRPNLVGPLVLLVTIVLVSNIVQDSADLWLCKEAAQNEGKHDYCAGRADARTKGYQQTIQLLLAMLAGRGISREP